MKRHKNMVLFILLVIAVPLLFVADIIFGSVSIPFDELVHVFFGNSNNKIYKTIVFQSRIPKALAAIICGASLSLSGLQMQALFRNPLAGPYILGISNGAGLGVALLVMIGSIFGVSVSSNIGISIAAMFGAGLILLFIFIVSLKIKDIMTVLIVGIMLGAISTAIIGVIQYVSSEAALKSFMLWSLGSLEGLSYSEILILLIVFLIGSILLLFQAKNLNLLLMGESYARSLGLDLKKTRIAIILSTSLLAGGVTAFCGPIGFIGIIVPHICRVIFQTSNHFILLPASFLMGVNVLLFSDILSHMPGSELILPINSVTSIIGIPVIIWMIIGKKSIAKVF